MPVEVSAYASFGPTEKLSALTIPRRDLQPHDVRINIKYTGVCGTDLHLIRNEWNKTSYPIVPGHEIIGIVSETGHKVAKFAVGDVVAVGCTVDSCGKCIDCKDYQEQFCKIGRISTYNSPDPFFEGKLSTYGGYSKQVLVQENFVLKVPRALYSSDDGDLEIDYDKLAKTAPIACAGVTTWLPLRRFNAGPGTRVGVIGLGGLGHMAVKLAVALGSEVTVVTRNAKKADYARKIGASNVIVSSNASETSDAARSLDLLIDTIPCEHSISPYIDLLRPNGAFVMLGYFGPLTESKLSSPQLIFENKILTGSFIGGQRATQEVYDFCGEHGIFAEIELVPMSGINEAFQKMDKGEVRSRFVIDVTRE